MKKILIADDEPEIIELLKTLLEPAGYSVVSTSYGSQLFPLVKKEKPDLLILDVMLPGIDGYSLQLHLSQQEEGKNLPVIVISALSASKALFDRFGQVKCFFTKPFNTDEMLKKIKEILI
jgi:DNA-binding response OmpR family regulator